MGLLGIKISRMGAWEVEVVVVVVVEVESDFSVRRDGLGLDKEDEVGRVKGEGGRAKEGGRRREGEG